MALACTNTFQCSKSSNSTSFRKLVVFVSESLSLKFPLIKRYFVNSSISSSLLTQNLAFLAQLYTSYIKFLSLRQDVVLETPSNTCKGEQTKLIFNLHSPISVDTRHKAQRRNKANYFIQSNTLSLTDNQPFCLSPLFPEIIRIKKGKQPLI